MTTVKKTGFGFWKKTVVEHNGRTDTYGGNAEVAEKDGSVCVTERGLFTDNSTCYLTSSKDKNSGSSLPDGTLVGKSKNITVENTNGERTTYASGILSINSMEKNGDKVHVVQNGVFGKKIIDTIDAVNINAIDSEDCNVCKSINPYYKN